MANRLVWLRQVSVGTNTTPAMPQKTLINIPNLGDAAGVAVDKSQNIFVSDTANHVIYKYRWGSSQVPFVFAGTYGVSGVTNGQGTNAKFNSPGAIAVDKSGNLFVCDNGNGLIRRIDANGNVFTVAATEIPSVETPGAITVDESGNIFLVDNH